MSKKRVLQFINGGWLHSNEALVKALPDAIRQFSLQHLPLMETSGKNMAAIP